VDRPGRGPLSSDPCQWRLLPGIPTLRSRAGGAGPPCGCCSTPTATPGSSPAGEPDPVCELREDRRGAPGVAAGALSPYYGDRKVGEGQIRTQPGLFAIAGEGLTVGRDGGDAVTDDYPGTALWAFTGGTLHRIAVDVSGAPYVDLEREAAAKIARE
jgi:hypothetical protein